MWRHSRCRHKHVVTPQHLPSELAAVRVLPDIVRDVAPHLMLIFVSCFEWYRRPPCSLESCNFRILHYSRLVFSCYRRWWSRPLPLCWFPFLSFALWCSYSLAIHLKTLNLDFNILHLIDRSLFDFAPAYVVLLNSAVVHTTPCGLINLPYTLLSFKISPLCINCRTRHQ